jgi:starch phosphorylase
MFPDYPISAITNGVHSQTWTAPGFQKLYDKHIPNWRNSSLSLRNAFIIPLEEVWSAHQIAKKVLLDFVQKKKKIKLELGVFTIGLARRFTPYKRLTLLFSDMEKLLQISKEIGRIQIICAGKAHPKDKAGKELIKEIYNLQKQDRPEIKIVYLENYDMNLSKLLVSGVDLWLNTPLPPNEASGTSGMKAAHNGVPQLSTWDGWWKEGYVKNKTGWSIRGDEIDEKEGDISFRDAFVLYRLLEQEILPRYYYSPENWREIMRFTIGVNASFFNTERVLSQYIQEAYL